MSSMTLTSLRIGNYYNSSKTALSNSLEKLSSGIKYRAPKDGVAEYMSLDKMKGDHRGYTHIQRGLKQTMAIMGTAEEVGTLVQSDIAELKQLTEDYWNAEPGSTDQTNINGKFTALASSITTLMDSAFANGKDLIQAGTLTSVMLNPNKIDQTLDITYDAGDIADTSGLTVNGGADLDSSMALIDAEFDKSTSYLSKTTGYIHSLDSQLRVTDAIMENNEAMRSTLNTIDDAAEMSKYVTNDIRQQASLSMLSQANMIRGGVLKLIM